METTVERKELDSLMYSSGLELVNIQHREREDIRSVIAVCGEVRIIDVENEEDWCGDRRFKNKELMELIESGEIYKSTKYELDMTNWFAFRVYRIVDNKWCLVAEEVWDSVTTDNRRLVKEMEEYTEYILDRFNIK